MKKPGENFRLRMVSIIIAVVLWIFVVNLQSPDIKRQIDNVPVNIINADSLTESGLILTDYQDFTTNVKVKAKQELIKKLSVKNIEAIADLKDCNKVGKISIPIRFNILGIQDVEVVGGKPNKIDINIEKFVQLEKNVEVVLEGEQNSDSFYSVKLVNPNTIAIGGPQKLIDSIDRVKSFVDVTNQQKDISIYKNYRIFNKNGIDITDTKGLVKNIQNVQINVAYSKAKTKEVPIIPVFTGKIANGYDVSQIKVEPDKINITGSPERIDAINRIQTENLDMSSLDNNAAKEVNLVIPADIKTNFSGTVKVKKKQ